MSYITIGPDNAKQTLAVCPSCPFRRRNIDQSFEETIKRSNQKVAALKKNDQLRLLPTKFIVSAAWTTIWKLGNVQQNQMPCVNDTLKLRDTTSSTRAHERRICAGRMAVLYQLRGTSRWTKKMEAAWQAGHFPKVMLVPDSLITVEEADASTDPKNFCNLVDSTAPKC